MGTDGSAHPQSRVGISQTPAPRDNLPHTSGLFLTSGPCLGPSDLLYRFLDLTHPPVVTSWVRELIPGLKSHVFEGEENSLCSSGL